MFRHGWPQPSMGSHEEKRSAPTAGPDTRCAWQHVARQLRMAAAGVPAQALDAAATALQRLQTACRPDSQHASGSDHRQPALASLSGAMLQRQRAAGTLRFHGRGLQQVFGDVAEAPSTPEGKLEAASEPDQQPEDDPMAAEERILISEVGLEAAHCATLIAQPVRTTGENITQGSAGVGPPWSARGKQAIESVSCPGSWRSGAWTAS